MAAVAGLLAAGSHLGPVGEIRLVPDPRTFALLPYSPREARLLCDMHTLDGRPWALCPRAFLIDMVDRAGQQGLRVEAAFETNATAPARSAAAASRRSSEAETAITATAG